MSRKNEKMERPDSAKKDTDNVRAGGGDSGSSGVTLSEESKKSLAEYLLPKLKDWIDTAIDERFKKLEPQVGTPTGTQASFQSGGGVSQSSTGTPGPDVQNLIKQATAALGLKPGDVNWGGTQGMDNTPADPTAANPIANLLGGGNPLQGLLIQFLGKELGLGQQQNPMGSFMPELIMRSFMEDISFGSFMKKAMLSRLLKDPALMAEYEGVANSFVNDPLKQAAAKLSLPSGSEQK